MNGVDVGGKEERAQVRLNYVLAAELFSREREDESLETKGRVDGVKSEKANEIHGLKDPARREGGARPGRPQWRPCCGNLHGKQRAHGMGRDEKMA